jgi:hypothetical protein
MADATISTTEDVWGVVSGRGELLQSRRPDRAVFAKVDYTFADQTQGVGVKAGMRYNWWGETSVALHQGVADLFQKLHLA